MPNESSTPLGAFLKTRRDRLTPEQAGLAPGIGLRRTPGLRREELAALAGISNDYYIRLERGKERNPSHAVVDSLARALQLGPDEHRHLRELAHLPPPVGEARSGEVPIGLLRMVEALRPLPAFVTNRIGDYLAWNPSGLALLTGLADWPVGRRNAARYGFTHPAARELYVEWEAEVTGLVYGLRRLAAAEPVAPDVAALVAELQESSADFRRLWDGYVVGTYVRGSQQLRHPVVGRLTVDYQVMRDGAGDLALMAYHAQPTSGEYRAFVELDSGELPPDR